MRQVSNICIDLLLFLGTLPLCIRIQRTDPEFGIQTRVVDAQTEEVAAQDHVGVTAVLRFQDPQHQVMGPLAFIPDPIVLPAPGRFPGLFWGLGAADVYSEAITLRKGKRSRN